MSAPRRHAGFTLIEVLVALAIVAITLGAGIRAAGALTDSTARLSEVVAAQWCADNYLTGLKLAKTFPTGDNDFTCDQLGRRYIGKLISRGMPISPDYRQVIAIISDEAGRPVVTITTMFARN